MSGLRIDRIDWHPQRALATVDRLSARATERGGQVLLAGAQRRVPYRTGELAGSARLVAGDEGVAVGYEAEHARFLHAHPEWNFQGGRSGRWLDEAVEDEADVVGRVMADTFRSGWPG